MAKTFIWIGLFLGSILGGLIPSLWGENFLSASSMIFSAIGALFGIWIGYKLGQTF